ncbi:hypothetical protein ACHAW6_002483, partial [Cyclotella cf. meneghiniana]
PNCGSSYGLSVVEIYHFATNNCGYSGTRYDFIAIWVHLLFLKAKSEASKEDSPSWKQAMSGPIKKEYWDAAVKEIQTLESMDAWEVVDQTDDMNVIHSIWAFKLKHFPVGMVKKFKAKFCACGDQQSEGVDYFETYAPVVQCTIMWALKHFSRYLKATRDKFLILRPAGMLEVDAYPDAEFAGLYGYGAKIDPACAKSRTGFLITVSYCPIVWVSKLQTETAMSMMEAEIIALVHCCHELLP